MFFVPISHAVNRAVTRESSPLAHLLGAIDNTASRSPALDVAETDAGYTVKLEMPGVAKDDIKVSVEGRKVSLQAQSATSDEKKDGERVLYRERPATSYARSFTLPVEVDQAESGAKLEHGVLTLTLPKRHVRAAAQITVN